MYMGFKWKRLGHIHWEHCFKNNSNKAWVTPDLVFQTAIVWFLQPVEYFEIEKIEKENLGLNTYYRLHFHK